MPKLTNGKLTKGQSNARDTRRSLRLEMQDRVARQAMSAALDLPTVQSSATAAEAIILALSLREVARLPRRERRASEAIRRRAGVK